MQGSDAHGNLGRRLTDPFFSLDAFDCVVDGFSLGGGHGCVVEQSGIRGSVLCCTGDHAPDYIHRIGQLLERRLHQIYEPNDGVVVALTTSVRSLYCRARPPPG